MKTIKTGPAVKGGKCACCGEFIRKHESSLMVLDGDSIVRGGLYCPHHDEDDIRDEHGIGPERGEEYAQEEFQSYREAGAVSAYWEDQA